MIDKMLTGSEISETEINNLIHTLQLSTVPQTLLTYFCNILRDNGSKFPTATAEEDPSTRPQTVEDFKKQLLFFWTGSRTYNNEFRYNLIPRDIDVFKAHTCFHQMEFPTIGNGVSSEKNMYKMLVRTVGLEGFGFY